MRDRLILFCCCDTAPWPRQTKEMSLSGLMVPRGLVNDGGEVWQQTAGIAGAA